MSHLPYVFKDPVQFDKKIDPRSLQFGSKINHQSGAREEYHRVRDILSPEQLVLDDGVRIRLLGIKEKVETRAKAMQFLEERTRGQRVMLRFDATKFDADNNLLCYLYLQNKTFVNAHMIKAGLVATDSEVDFRLKKKFMLLAQAEAS